MIVVVMGVSGTGKSAVGARLARELGWAFVEGDDHHPAANIQKMSRGEPLTDQDRAPWLASLRAEIECRRRDGRDTVLTCSALRRVYRDALRRPGEADIVLVHLAGRADLIRARMTAREHFMRPGMLESQLATLEPPGADEGVIEVGIDGTVDAIAAEIRRRLAGAAG